MAANQLGMQSILNMAQVSLDGWCREKHIKILLAMGFYYWKVQSLSILTQVTDDPGRIHTCGFPILLFKQFDTTQLLQSLNTGLNLNEP